MQADSKEPTPRGSEEREPDVEDCPGLGTGAMCAEAQADGVPCFESGRDCEKCDRAWKRWGGRPIRKAAGGS